MRRKHILLAALMAILPGGASAQEASSKAWTLQQCIDYALAHNVQLKKNHAAEQTAAVNVSEAKAGRLPSLSASLTQNLNYRPFQETGGNFVNGGIATSATDKATQSGSYGVNASWVVWNGNKTRLNITNAQLTQQMASLETEQNANSMKEQIAQLYTQILYMSDAARVNRILLTQDSTVLARGKEMVSVGQMAKADLAQLQAQVSQGRYDIVNVETQIADAKMQLRQLLELPADTAFDVESTNVTDGEVMLQIPSKEATYTAALACRPEIKRSQLAIEQSKVNTKLAKAGYMPTVSLTGSLGDSHMTGATNGFFNQMKQNFSTMLGVSVSIPIFDNRKNKSAVEKAQIAETTAQLDLTDTQKTLYKTVETYWLNATNSQAKYVAAKSNVESLQTSYDLMNEQFEVGLKNIAELLNNRASLLNAQQQMLQDKYTAWLNRSLLSFYAGNEIAD